MFRIPLHGTFNLFEMLTAAVNLLDRKALGKETHLSAFYLETHCILVTLHRPDTVNICPLLLVSLATCLELGFS